MKKGHVTGGKKEHTPRPSTTTKLEAMGAAIAAQFAGKTPAEMVERLRQPVR